ncbi:MAG: hypothetical protein ABFD12_10250 [Syntrophorhabdus sp.]
MNRSRKHTRISSKAIRTMAFLTLAIIITGIFVTPSFAWDKKHYKPKWHHGWHHGHYYATPMYAAPAVVYAPAPVYYAPPPPPPPGISVVFPLHIH